MRAETRASIITAGGWALLGLALGLELLSYLDGDRPAVLASLRASLAVAMAVQWQRDRRQHGAAIIDPWYLGALAVLTLSAR